MRQATRPARLIGGFLAAATLLLASTSSAQSSKDQVGWVDKSGRAKTWTGIITENSLSQTIIQVEDRERKVPSTSVTSIRFGAVPPAFKEGQSYFERGDFETAAARFQVAATDASASDSVKAAARFRAGDCWMQAGASFGKAAEQLQRYRSDYPNARGLPLATLKLGRAKWLGEDPKAAAELLRSLFQENQTKGYAARVAFRAGVFAAQAFLAAGDSKTAKSLFAEVQPALAAHMASLDDANEARFELGHIEADALLGEGFCLLADGKTSQAKSFFSGKISSAPKASALVYGARLGLGQALFAAGETRNAQIEFSVVSALDSTSPDRVAEAMIGLTQCALKLPDTSSRQNAKLWLETIQNQFGATPSVLRVPELIKSL